MLLRQCLLSACFITTPVDLTELVDVAHSKAIKHMVLTWQMGHLQEVA